MTRKQQLEQELAEIKKQEQIAAEQKEQEDLLNSGFYKPLAFAKVKNTIWYCSGNDFREIDDGYYTASQILRSPTFRKDDEVVLIDYQDDKRWYKKRDDNDYFYIEDNEYGIPEDEAENLLKDII